MAWHFDEVDDYVTMPDGASFSIPDADWCISGWVKLDDNTGSTFQYFYSHDVVLTNPSMNLYIHEASNADPGEFHMAYYEDSTNFFDLTSTTAPFTGNTGWTHILVQRSGTTGKIYVDNVELGTDTDSAVNAGNPTGLVNFGRRQDGDSARYFGGDLAEFAKWDRAMDAEQRQALANGFAPSHFMNDLIWYCPMIRDYTEVVGGLTVTNNGSTIADHPPMIYPKSAIVPVPLQSTAFAVVVNDSLVYDGTAGMSRTWAVVINDSLVFDGTGTLNVGRAVVVNDTLVFDGTAGMSRTWAVVINDSLIFDGTGDIGRKWDAVINDALVFDGTGVVGRGSAVVINDSLVFGGSITAALTKKWYDTGDDTALSLSWSNTADDTATDPSWSDSPDDTATDPSWGDI